MPPHPFRGGALPPRRDTAHRRARFVPVLQGALGRFLPVGLARGASALRALFGGRTRVVALVAVLAAGIVAPCDPAHAHEFYPQGCCDATDCFALPAGAVEPVAGGWRIVGTGEVIPFAAARPSPDGRFHRCSPGGDPALRTLRAAAGFDGYAPAGPVCFWAPGAGA